MKATIAQKRVSKFKIIIPIFIFLLPAISWAADLSIPDARRVDWQGNVGVRGGIPTVTTNCETAACNTLYSGGANVTVANINAAIASAINPSAPYSPDRTTVVRIPAGTFNLGSGGIQINRGNVILRGAGKNATILQSTESNTLIGTNATNADYGSQQSITDGYIKGSMHITISDTSTMSIGDTGYLTQDNESWMYADSGSTQSFKQLVQITNILGNTIYFTPALTFGSSSSPNPKYQPYWGAKQGYPQPGYMGIEDMKLDFAGVNDPFAAIQINDFYNVWIKNVEIANFGELGIFTYNTIFGTITGCYFNTVQPTLDQNGNAIVREGHGVYLYGQTTGWLVENNYSKSVWATVVGLNPVGSVIAYNYAYDTFSPYTGTARSWQVQSYITQHGPHEMQDLWEGNVGNAIQNDGYHGSGSHQTIFRNWINGLSPRGYTLNRKLIDLDRWSYYHNVIGNVLGDPSWTPEYYQMTTTQPDYSHSTIYRLGFPNMGNYGYIAGNPPYGAATNCGPEWNAGTTYSIWTQVIVSADNTVWYSKQNNNLNHPPASSPDWWGSTRLWDCAGYDDQVQATIVRHMNFDYYNNTVRTCDQESEGCQGVTGTTVPASLYLSAKPSWWCNESPWPAIGPDVSGYHGKIPAQIAFEGGTCTLGGGDTTPPAAPSGFTVK